MYDGSDELVLTEGHDITATVGFELGVKFLDQNAMLNLFKQLVP